MKIGKTYIEFISEKKSKKKSPAAQIKKLTKKQKTLIDKSKDIKDEVSKLAADKDKNPEDKLTSLLLKNKINQLKKIKLIDILRLDENNVDKFFARYGEQDRKVEEQRFQLKNSINQLEQAILEYQTVSLS